MNRLYAKAAAWRLFAAVSAMIGGIVGLRLTSQHLTPEVYGVIAVALQILAYLPLLDLGYRTVLNQRLLATPTDLERGELAAFSQSYLSRLALLLVVLGPVVLCVLSSTPRTKEVGLSFGFYAVMGGLGGLLAICQLQAGLLVGMGRQNQFAAVSGLGACAHLGALWFGYTRGWAEWAFVSAMLVNFSSSYIVSLLLIKRARPALVIWPIRLSLDYAGRRDALRHDAWQFFRGQVTVAVLFSVDLVLVGIVATPAVAARYAIASRLFAIGKGLIQIFGEAAWPIIAEKGHIEDRLKAGLIYATAVLYGSSAGAACVGIGPVMNWYLGEQWEVSGTIIWLLAARFAITGVASSLTYVLYGMGRFEVVRRILDRELILAIVLAALMGPFFGAQGIAVVFLVSTGAGTVYVIFRAYAKETGDVAERVWWRCWWRMSLSFVVSVVVGHWTMDWFRHGWQTLLGGALAGGAGLSVCGATWWALTRCRAVTMERTGA
jgi:O-antigen/teichoic acid export membrane protein